jgi:hypothetical protein
MNYKRLQKLEETLGQLQKVYSDLESIRDEEQEDYESMPEFKRYSEVGKVAIENAEGIDSIISELDNVIADLKEIVDNNA